MKPKFIISLSLIVASLFAAQSAMASDHEKTFGVKTGYVSRNQSAVAGLFFQYSFTDHFRISPEVNVAFRSEQRDGFLFDVNAHFPLKKSGIAEYYPLAGLNYSSWSLHSTYADEIQSKDVTNRTSRLGINLGGGMNLKMSSTLSVKIEVAYTMVQSNSAFRATVGIGYSF
jgi:opacity protein-like surface antigen